MKTVNLIYTIVLVSSTVMLTHCKKEVTGADKTLFEKSNTTTGFTFYKNDNSILPTSNQGGHNKPFRVRFNAIAQAALTDNGKLPAGGSFPEGSLIVKEVYDANGNSVQILAVMEKATTNSSASAGWLWAEYSPDGKEIISVADKGQACISCHSIDSRDKLRLFNLFP
jgi:hypothetical protein